MVNQLVYDFSSVDGIRCDVDTLTKEWTLKNTTAISRSYEGKYCELSCTTALITLDILN
jgi:hypothetical protein